MAEKKSRRPGDQTRAAAGIFSSARAEDIHRADGFQPLSAARLIAARFGLPVPTAAAVAELAGIGGVA